MVPNHDSTLILNPMQQSQPSNPLNLVLARGPAPAPSPLHRAAVGTRRSLGLASPLLSSPLNVSLSACFQALALSANKSMATPLCKLH